MGVIKSVIIRVINKIGPARYNLYVTCFNGVVYSLKDEYYFVLFQLLDVAATDLLNKSSGSPATTPLHLVVSFLCHSFIF